MHFFKINILLLVTVLFMASEAKDFMRPTKSDHLSKIRGIPQYYIQGGFMASPNSHPSASGTRNALFLTELFAVALKTDRTKIEQFLYALDTGNGSSEIVGEEASIEATAYTLDAGSILNGPAFIPDQSVAQYIIGKIIPGSFLLKNKDSEEPSLMATYKAFYILNSYFPESFTEEVKETFAPLVEELTEKLPENFKELYHAAAILRYLGASLPSEKITEHIIKIMPSISDLETVVDGVKALSVVNAEIPNDLYNSILAKLLDYPTDSINDLAAIYECVHILNAMDRFFTIRAYPTDLQGIPNSQFNRGVNMKTSAQLHSVIGAFDSNFEVHTQLANSDEIFPSSLVREDIGFVTSGEGIPTDALLGETKAIVIATKPVFSYHPITIAQEINFYVGTATITVNSVEAHDVDGEKLDESSPITGPTDFVFNVDAIGNTGDVITMTVKNAGAVIFTSKPQKLGKKLKFDFAYLRNTGGVAGKLEFQFAVSDASTGLVHTLASIRRRVEMRAIVENVHIPKTVRIGENLVVTATLRNEAGTPLPEELDVLMEVGDRIVLVGPSKDFEGWQFEVPPAFEILGANKVRFLYLEGDGKPKYLEIEDSEEDSFVVEVESKLEVSGHDKADHRKFGEEIESVIRVTDSLSGKDVSCSSLKCGVWLDLNGKRVQLVPIGNEYYTRWVMGAHMGPSAKLSVILGGSEVNNGEEIILGTTPVRGAGEIEYEYEMFKTEDRFDFKTILSFNMDISSEGKPMPGSALRALLISGSKKVGDVAVSDLGEGKYQFTFVLKHESIKSGTQVVRLISGEEELVYGFEFKYNGAKKTDSIISGYFLTFAIALGGFIWLSVQRFGMKK